MKRIFLTSLCSLFILVACSQIQCQANFTSIQNGPTTVFTDLSSITQGWTNYSVSWDWDLGDGNHSIQQNPIHTYANNGIYLVCLIVTYFDSTTINSCTSVYCDSIFVGNSIPASWDCNPISGCYDPGTGLGQYSSFAACDTMCGAPTPSWDCSSNSLLGCYDPGTGLGQYSSLAACQAVCGAPMPSWDCGTQGCYDPGTGLGAFTSLASCQASCVNTPSNLCDSMTASGSQLQMTIQLSNVNTFVYYWVTTAPDGNILAEDSMSTIHNVNNFTNPSTLLTYDTLTTCITYYTPSSYTTCCVNWVWNGSSWAMLSSLTNTFGVEIKPKKLIKTINIFGKHSEQDNQILFYLFDDGSVEKRYKVD